MSINYFKRIFISIFERKKDSLLILLIVLILSLFITILFSINKSSDLISTRIKENTKIEIKMTSDIFYDEGTNLKTYLEDNHISFIKYKDFISGIDDALDELVNHQDAIEDKKVSYYINVPINLYRNVESYENNYNFGLANIFSAHSEEFLNEERYKIKQGRFFNEDELRNGTFKILLKKSDYYNLDGSKVNVGDLIYLDSFDGTKYEYEVIGFLEGTPNLFANNNSYFENVDAIIPKNNLISIADINDDLSIVRPSLTVNGLYNVNDVKLSFNKEMTKVVQNTAFIEYDLIIDDKLAKDLQKPTENINLLTKIISTIMISILLLLFGSFIIYLVKTRLKEFGILIALGQNAYKVVLSFFLEILFISIISVAISIPIAISISNETSKSLIASNIRRQERIAEISKTDRSYDIIKNQNILYQDYQININIKDILIIYLINIVIIFISSVVALIQIKIIKPKELLLKK